MENNTSHEQKTRLQLFQAFMSTPPALKAITWIKISTTHFTNGANSAYRSSHRNVIANRFLGRWQPGCIYLEKRAYHESELAGFDANAEVIIRRKQSCWMQSVTGLVTCWQDLSLDPGEIKTSPARALSWASGDLAEVLNMGVMYMQIGSAKWTGDAFKAETYVPELNTPMQITGQALLGDQGLVTTVKAQYKSSMAVWNYTLRYTYSSNCAPLCLPRTIVSVFNSGDSEVKMTEWRDISIQPSESPLDDHAFELPPKAMEDRTKVLFYTNDSWYARNAVGTLVEIAGPLKQTYNPVAGLRFGVRTLYFVGILITASIAFTFICKVNTKQKTT